MTGMATATAQTHAWSAARARKTCVVILLSPSFVQHAGLGRPRKSTNSRMQLLEFRKTPTTFKRRAGKTSSGTCEEDLLGQGVSGQFELMPMFTLM